MARTPGLGKTLLGLHFLADGERRGQRGLFAGFTENAAQLRAKAQTFGIDVEAAERAGSIDLLMVPPHDLDADLVAWLIRERIEERGVQRLVIDSATEFQGGPTSRERAPAMDQRAAVIHEEEEQKGPLRVRSARMWPRRATSTSPIQRSFGRSASNGHDRLACTPYTARIVKPLGERKSHQQVLSGPLSSGVSLAKPS